MTPYLTTAFMVVLTWDVLRSAPNVH